MSYPRTTRALREILDRHGLAPRKRHGQNFLTDVQAVDAIVRDAGVRSRDHVVEVGTGVGLLTHALASTGARVSSFEVDADMLELTRGLEPWPERVTFVEGDVLAGKHALAPAFVRALEAWPEPPGRLLVVSNLPYGAGTPILLGMLALPRPPAELVVMLQREVAEKLLAEPGTRAYGAPSVAVGLKAEGRILRRFGPEVFWPRPKVQSAVLRLVPHGEAPIEVGEHDPFGRFVTALFSRRRKVLRAALKGTHPVLDPDVVHQGLEAAGIDAKARVETVPPAALLDLWRALGRPEPS